MAVSISLSGFPTGVTVGAYRKQFFSGLPPVEGQTPGGSPVSTTETASSLGIVTFTGLLAETAYYAGAQIGGVWKWTSFRTNPEQASGGGGAELLPNSISTEFLQNGAVTTPKLGEASVTNPILSSEAVSEGKIKAEAVTESKLAAKAVSKAKLATAVQTELAIAVPAGTAALPTKEGKVKPDLKEGHRVFSVTTTGVFEPEPPINGPGAGVELAVELWITGNKTISPKGLTGWIFGEEPEWVLSSPTSLNVLGMVSIDGGATWYGVGTAGIPSSVMRITSGSPSAGEAAVSDGSGGWEPGGVLVKTAAVDARIKALSILTGEHETSATNAPANGSVPLGASASTYTWTNLVNILTELTTHRIEKGADVSTTSTLTTGEHHYYRLTKKAITVTLPATTLTLAGELLMLENTSEGPIKIKGPIGSAAVIEKELEPGEAWLLWKSLGGEGEEWRIVSRSRQTADVVVPDINTAAKTSAQITTAVEASFAPEKPPRNTQMIVDNTNKKVLFYNGTTKKWLESAAFTVI